MDEVRKAEEQTVQRNALNWKGLLGYKFLEIIEDKELLILLFVTLVG